MLTPAMATTFAGGVRRGRLKGFLISRLAQIYPLHVVVLGGFLLMELAKVCLNLAGVGAARFEPFSGNYPVKGFFLNLFLLQTTGLQSNPSWNGPSLVDRRRVSWSYLSSSRSSRCWCCGGRRRRPWRWAR